MKAWIVRGKDNFCATVVFAETRGKARALAMNTDACEDVEFCDIEVRRKPQIDKYYKEGKKEMEWYDLKDRLALVKECDFRCEDMELYECEVCLAKQYCSLYEDYISESEDTE